MTIRYILNGILLFLLALSGNVFGQSVPEDTPGTAPFKKTDLFPAISYSPETNLTVGVIGIRYFDFSGGAGNTPMSNAEFLAVYTLNNQILLETRWEVFGRESRWRTRGEAFFNRFPDRNYGIGNDAGALVYQIDDEGKADTVNYLFFDSDRIKFSPVVLRKVRTNLYFGLQYDMEYLFRMSPIPESYILLNDDAGMIPEMAVAGFRSGLGIQLLFDTRDYILNPLKGTLIEFNNLYYGKFAGSDFAFTRLHLDARQYLNPASSQTLAIRLYGSFEFTDDAIPMRALSRAGGHKFIRGYFRGTYQDHHMTAFEAEYRLPFWKPDTTSKLWQVWKRLGVVGFISGAQAFHEPGDFAFDRFNLAAGGGLRILFNPESRVNLRIDYAIGLAADSGGPGKRQSGFYFFLGEAF